MAQLPSETYLIQQIGQRVVLFHRYTEEELVSFDPSDRNAVAVAQSIIHRLDQLTPEDRGFAHFWSGYFYAHASAGDDI